MDQISTSWCFEGDFSQNWSTNTKICSICKQSDSLKLDWYKYIVNLVHLNEWYLWQHRWGSDRESTHWHMQGGHRQVCHTRHRAQVRQKCTCRSGLSVSTHRVQGWQILGQRRSNSPKWDKFWTLSDQISVNFGSEKKSWICQNLG